MAWWDGVSARVGAPLPACGRWQQGPESIHPVIASHWVRAKRGPMTGSAKQSRLFSAERFWIASLRSQ